MTEAELRSHFSAISSFVIGAAKANKDSPVEISTMTSALALFENLLIDIHRIAENTDRLP